MRVILASLGLLSCAPGPATVPIPPRPVAADFVSRLDAYWRALAAGDSARAVRFQRDRHNVLQTPSLGLYRMEWHWDGTYDSAALLPAADDTSVLLSLLLSAGTALPDCSFSRDDRMPLEITFVRHQGDWLIEDIRQGIQDCM